MQTSFQPEYDYLRPPASTKLVTHEDSYKLKITSARRIRRIFYKTEFDEMEKQKLQEFEELLKRDQITLPPWWNKQETLRWCYSKRLDLPQSLSLFKNYLNWSQDPKYHKLTPEGLEALKKGVVYQLGRDSKMRPIMIVDVRKIVDYQMDVDHFINAMVHVLEVIRMKMYLPGHVENNIVIIETDSMSLFNVPLGHLQGIISTASNNYPESLAKMYILNPSFILRTSWNLVKNMMEAETSDKISILKSDEFDQIQQLIPKDQLEEKFGGTLPNLTEFWPPRLTVPADQIVWNNCQYEAGRFDPNLNYKLKRNKNIPVGVNICQQSSNTAGIQGEGVMKLQKSQSEIRSEISEEGKDALLNRSAMKESFQDCLNSSQFPKETGLLEEQGAEVSMYYSAKNLPGGEPSVLIIEKNLNEEEEDYENKENDDHNRGGLIIPAGALLKMNQRRQIQLEAHGANQNNEMFCGICKRPEREIVEEREEDEESLPEVDESTPVHQREECVLI